MVHKELNIATIMELLKEGWCIVKNRLSDFEISPRLEKDGETVNISAGMFSVLLRQNLIKFDCFLDYPNLKYVAI